MDSETCAWHPLWTKRQILSRLAPRRPGAFCPRHVLRGADGIGGRLACVLVRENLDIDLLQRGLPQHPRYLTRLASDTRLLIDVYLWQSHISAASSHDRPLATAQDQRFTLLVAGAELENAEELVGLDTGLSLLDGGSTAAVPRSSSDWRSAPLVHPAQGGEHSRRPQANPDARPVHRGEGLHNRLTHKIVGTLMAISPAKPWQKRAQMGNAGDDVRIA